MFLDDTVKSYKHDATTLLSIVGVLSGISLLPAVYWNYGFPFFHADEGLWHRIYAAWPLILMNNFADFGMTVAFAQFVQRTSGVAYSLLSVAKDVGIVVVRYKSIHLISKFQTDSKLLN